MIPEFKKWNPISLYLVCCYAYYEMDESLIPDGDFDDLCKNLLDRFDDLGDHIHKHFLTRENLESGTGFTISDYPSRVISLAKTYSESGGKKSCQQKNQCQKKAVKVAKSANLEEEFLSLFD